jgi:rubrerythrin
VALEIHGGSRGPDNNEKEYRYMTENNLQGASLVSGVQEEDQVLSSRRKFLTGSATLLAGGALAAVLPRAAQAHETGRASNVDMLNYALTLEHLEYIFYREGLKKFDESDFRRYFARNREYEKQGIRDIDGEAVRRKFVVIREHEETHVETLEFVISEVLEGTPVPRARYNFEQTAFTSVGKFVSVAQFLENTGVSAYDGAIAHIEAAKLLTAGATIATVEARHAAYLNLLNGTSPFPEAFDTPVAPRAICEAVKAENGGFIVSAPTPYGRYRSLDALCEKLPGKTRTL